MLAGAVVENRRGCAVTASGNDAHWDCANQLRRGGPGAVLPAGRRLIRSARRPAATRANHSSARVLRGVQQRAVQLAGSGLDGVVGFEFVVQHPFELAA